MHAHTHRHTHTVTHQCGGGDAVAPRIGWVQRKNAGEKREKWRERDEYRLWGMQPAWRILNYKARKRRQRGKKRRGVCNSRRRLKSLRSSKTQDVIMHHQLSILHSTCHSHKPLPSEPLLCFFLLLSVYPPSFYFPSLSFPLPLISDHPRSLSFFPPASLLCKDSAAATYESERERRLVTMA